MSSEDWRGISIDVDPVSGTVWFVLTGDQDDELAERLRPGNMVAIHGTVAAMQETGGYVDYENDLLRRVYRFKLASGEIDLQLRGGRNHKLAKEAKK